MEPSDIQLSLLSLYTDASRCDPRRGDDTVGTKFSLQIPRCRDVCPTSTTRPSFMIAPNATSEGRRTRSQNTAHRFNFAISKVPLDWRHTDIFPCSLALRWCKRNGRDAINIKMTNSEIDNGEFVN